MEGLHWGAHTAQLGGLHGHMYLRAARSALCMFTPASSKVQPAPDTMSCLCVIAALHALPSPGAISTALNSQSSYRD